MKERLESVLASGSGFEELRKSIAQMNSEDARSMLEVARTFITPDSKGEKAKRIAVWNILTLLSAATGMPGLEQLTESLSKPAAQLRLKALIEELEKRVN